MAKKLLFMITLLLVASVFVIGTMAATTTAYVKSGATGTGLTSSSPVGSLTDAFKLFGSDGGTIYVIGEYPITTGTTITEKKFDYTIKAGSGGCISLSANLALAQNTNNNTVTFDLPFKLNGSDTRILFGGFNNVVFGKNFSVNAPSGGSLDFYGGMRSGSVEAITEIPYSIVVNAGTFNVFAGGNFRDSISAYVGSIAAPVSITVKGGTFGKSGTYSTASNNKDYDTFSVSGMSFLADGATLNISGGTFYHPIYIQGRLGTVASGASAKSNKVKKNKKYYAIDGDVTVNISGGTFKGGAVSAYYVQPGYTTVMRGNYTVNITGGTFASGTKFDATQVKAYSGSTKKATITYPTSKTITPIRFDVVNGTKKTYTDPIRVVFIGDSITEGYAVDDAGVDRRTESYPSKFLKYAEAAGKEVIISNFGVAAAGLHPSTKRFYNNMLAWPLAKEEAAPDYVFIAIGINDATAIGGTNGAFTTFKSNYTNLLKTMGNLPDTDKVFVTNAIYCDVSDVAIMHRAGAVLRHTQQILAEDLAETDAKKYVFVDFFGLTLSKALDGSLFRAENGNIYERLHPATDGLDFMGYTLYKAAFGGVTAPSTSYKKTAVYVSDKGTSRGAGTASAPISDISYAYSLLDPNKASTIYVDGTISIGLNLHTPVSTQTVTFVGVGSNAVINIYGNTLKAGSNVKFDNLTIKASGEVLNIHGCYKNVEFTSTVKTSGVCNFHAGFNVFADVSASSNTIHDNASSASTNRNCTVKINGGTFRNFTLGNARYASSAPIGTYSGTMNATIGSGVTVGDSNSTYVGIVGQNYITGTINATVNGWGSGSIPEYSAVGSRSESVSYSYSKNTGAVYIKSTTGLSGKIKYKEVTPSISYDGEAVKLTWNAKGAAERYRIFRRKAGESSWDSVSRYTATTSYTDKTIATNTKYEYAVQAWIPIGDGYDYSEAYVVTITTKLLPTPSATVKNSADGITVTISSVSGAEGYKIYRSTDNKNFTQLDKTTANSYVDTTAVANTKYYYKVRAYNQAEGTRYSADSASVSIIRLAPVKAGFSYDDGDKCIYVTWSAVKDAERYRIFRRKSGESAWDEVNRYESGTTYVDSSVSVGVTYEYAVQAWVPFGDGYVYGPLKPQSITPVASAATTLTAKNTVDGVSLTATAVSGVDGYIFFRSTDGKTLTRLNKSTTNTYVDTTAKADTKYNYYVCTYTDVSRSKKSEAFTVIRLAPISVSASYDGGDGCVYLSWSAVKDAERYRIFRRTFGESAWDEVTRYESGTVYTDNSASVGVTYEYAVQAWVPLGDGYVYGPLKVKTVTPLAAEPTTLTAKNTVDGVSLTATAVSDVDGYIFFRSTDGKTLTRLNKSTSNTYVDKTAKADTTYYYYVCTYIDVCRSKKSDAFATVRVTPIDFGAYFDGADNSIHITWNAVKDAARYRIFRRVLGESAWDEVYRYESGTEYIDTSVTIGVTYEYAVQAWVTLGEGYVYGPLLVDKVTPELLKVPVLSVKLTENSVILSSAAVENANGYTFYRSTDGENFELLASSAVNTYADTDVKAGTKYYYKACACFENGDRSDYSNVVTVQRYDYVETHNGTGYEKVHARAGENEFTYLEMQNQCGTTAVLKEIPTSSYVYCVYGDFIVQNAMPDYEAGTVTVPYPNADAIIFAEVPIIKYGDANGNGSVSLLDALKVFAYTANPSTELDIAAANINGDIRLSLEDVLGVIKSVLN